MEPTTQIHGLPKPPLGYRLAVEGDKRCEGAKFWNPDRAQWLIAAGGITGPLVPYYIYAVPLNDGYEYFEAGTTVIQAGDEEVVGPGSRKCTPFSACFGQTNLYPLRRPKAKPPTKRSDRIERIAREVAKRQHAAVGAGFHDVYQAVKNDHPEWFESDEKVSPLAPGRNINGLTEDQVGTSEGWRLITDREFAWELAGAAIHTPLRNKCEATGPGQVKWDPIPYPNLHSLDYRTKAPLPGEKAKTEMCQFIRPGGYVTTVELTPRAADIILPLLMELANGGHVSSVLPVKEAR